MDTKGSEYFHRWRYMIFVTCNHAFNQSPNFMNCISIIKTYKCSKAMILWEAGNARSINACLGQELSLAKKGSID